MVRGHRWLGLAPGKLAGGPRMKVPLPPLEPATGSASGESRQRPILPQHGSGGMTLRPDDGSKWGLNARQVVCVCPSPSSNACMLNTAVVLLLPSEDGV